ncbi:MAG: signal peptidase I [Candidatus Zambryskibacteria bacterium]|nr:signal peptidase I [Candidatus Zambryskibacteria bacterium]
MNSAREIIKLILLSIVIVIPFRLFIAQPFIVEGASMEPTFESGEYLIVDELSYYWKTPERGSVLVFKYPKDPSKRFIKRVIGLPEETVSLRNGTVTIINDGHPEGFVLEESYIEIKKDETVNYILGKGEYFVMGDNRLWSSDSRVWGPVPEDNIIGRPIIQFLPPEIFPGEVNVNNP